MKIAIDREAADRVIEQLESAYLREGIGNAAQAAIRHAAALIRQQAENRDLLANANHAATCIYCGEAVIYDTREEADMQAAHQRLVDHDQTCPRNPLVARVAELEAQVERLRQALQDIDSDLEGRNFLEKSSLRDTARSALNGGATVSIAQEATP